jgi:hypothetical protein
MNRVLNINCFHLSYFYDLTIECSNKSENEVHSELLIFDQLYVRKNVRDDSKEKEFKQYLRFLILNCLSVKSD